MNKYFKEIAKYLGLIAIAIGLIMWYNSYKDKNLEFEIEIFCDFEKQNKNSDFITNSNDFVLQGGKVSQDHSYSGNQSLMLMQGQKYQEVLKLPIIDGKHYVSISYLQHVSGTAAIVAQGVVNKDFYKISNAAFRNIDDDWNEIVLNFSIEDSFDDTLKIYFFNPDETQTYIDDFTLRISMEPDYPEYEKEVPLLIYLEDSEFSKLEKKRKAALEKGILQTEDDSWANALIYGDGKMMNAEVRLKGDWLDHLHSMKWSLRIKLVDDSWKGMRVFSIQTPYSRGFTNEWIAHKECLEENIISTRYGFVPVYLNGKSLGLYAYEEHFQKELVEYHHRREGPIIKFSETDFWEFVLLNTPNGFAYESSVIEAFSGNKISKDTVQYNYFVLAANLLNMFREMQAPASQIFDVEKTAKYLAFVDARNGLHSLHWHNMRFYYNPVLSRLEPIGFDMFAGPEAYLTEMPVSIYRDKITANKTKNSLFYLLADNDFAEHYLQYLNHYTEKKKYESFFDKTKSEFIHIDSLLKIEFGNYGTSPTQFAEAEHRIRGFLPFFADSIKNSSVFKERIHEAKTFPFLITHPYDFDNIAHLFVKAYLNSENRILIKAFLPRNIRIEGFGNENELTTIFKRDIIKPVIEDFYEKEIIVEDPQSIDTYIYFSIIGQSNLFKTQLVEFPAPVNYNPRNDIAANAQNLDRFIIEDKKEIRFSGKLQFDNHIYIPKNYTVIFDAGTEVDLIKGSAFISNSTIEINGTKEMPVKIYSSDKSAMGFTVLQADKRSKLYYAYFDNLNTINYNGWLLTGGVTFYESDVDFYNCAFTNNLCEDNLNTIRCDFLLKDCLFDNSFSDAHDSDFCTGLLDNCTFLYSGNDAIDFSTSQVTIQNCTIKYTVDKAISVGENTKVLIKNVFIDDAGIGIAAKDLSHAEVDNCQMINTVYGFVLLQKKPEFGPASINAKNCNLEGVWKKHIIEKSSKLTLNGKLHKGSNNKLKQLFYE